MKTANQISANVVVHISIPCSILRRATSLKEGITDPNFI